MADDLRSEWLAHLCGLCLALRADHGQFARVATNYDGLVISALVEAQSPAGGSAGDRRRVAGPCLLRGMRTASVAQGEGARLAATVSLVLASAKVRDHVADRDGVMARRPIAAAARRVAARWDREGARTGADVGFDTALLLEAVDRQEQIERAAGPRTSLLEITEPTETATAAAFGHTAVLAGHPANRAPLAEAGRLFGRLAHLLDAVEDLSEDVRTAAWNPIVATGTDLVEVRRLCDDAVHGVRLALRDVEFSHDRLIHVLLAHELKHAVDRVFGPSCDRPLSAGGQAAPPGQGPNSAEARGAYGDGASSGSEGAGAYGAGSPAAGAGHPYQGYGPSGSGDGNPYGGGPHGGGPRGGGPSGPGSGDPHPRKRGTIAGCAVWLGLFCTCQICCREKYDDPWRKKKKREGWCHKCGDCDCSCCECCACCECGGGC